MSQETVFRIDAVIGGHSGGFKLAAKEAAKSAAGLRNDVAKYAVAQSNANREADRGTKSFAKMMASERAAAKAALDHLQANIALAHEIRQTIKETDRLVIVSKALSETMQKEKQSVIGAATALQVKGQESKKARDRQAELAAVAKIVSKELENEAEAARHAAMMLAFKGHESKKTARDQAEFVVQAARARSRMDEERKAAHDLSFELQRHRGVLASNIRSQPLFAAMVASTTAALGPLSSALGDAGAAAVALGGGLEPLMGNLVLLPSLAGAAGQGFLALGIGLHGVFKTLRAQGTTYQNDLAKLSKPAQEFVKTLRGAKFGNAFKELQLQIQTGLFPGLINGLKAAMPLLKPFSQVMWDTSKAIGHLAEIWGKFFGSKKFGSDFLQIGERNRQTIFRLGVAARNFTSALSDILVVAGPFVGHFTKMIQDASKAFEDFVHKGRTSGDLRKYFEEVEHRTGQWLSILKNTILFVHNLFVAARPLTDVIMNAWVKGAQAASDWARSSAPLKSFFTSSIAPLSAMARLVGALAKGLATLAAENQGNLVVLADSLSQHVVPALQAVAEFFADLIPSISATLASIADALKSILGDSDDLKTVLKGVLSVIRGIATAAKAIADTFGGVGLVIIGAAGLGGLRVAVALMKTMVKLARDAAFEKAGISIVGENLKLNRGKGLGKLIPGGTKTVTTVGEGGAAGAGGAGAVKFLPKLMSMVKGGVVRIPIILAVSAVAASTAESIKRGGGGVDRGLLGNIADKMLSGKGMITSKGAAGGLADIGHIITGGMIPTFKDHAAIDKAGNKMMDVLLARVKDIAQRRKLSIPVNFDIKNPSMPNKVLTHFVQELESTVSTTKNRTATWSSYFAELSTNVRLNMHRIAKSMKAGSDDAKVATAANFNTAAAAVMKSMTDMGRVTKQGIATVSKYLRQALAIYGVKGRDATAYIQTYIYRHEHPGSTGTGSNEGGSNKQLGYKEKGGFITGRGMRGKDNRPTVLGDGEAVLNYHQQRPVEYALQKTYGMTLDDLFEQEKRPHYMAQGGFVGNKRWPMLSGDLDFRPVVGNKLEMLAEKSGKRIYVQSGGRSLQEQAGLYAKYGPGRAAAPTPMAPHVRGIAADITPGAAAFAAMASQFGLGFPMSYEPWHIQLTDAAAESSGGGIVQKLKDVAVDLAGVPGGLAQKAVDVVHGAAQSVLDGISSEQVMGDGASPGNVPGGITGKGHPGRNMSIARSMMRAFGWGGDQWPSLKALWQGESGWDEFARNKDSGAAGIPQALGHGNVFAMGDAEGQIRWGLNYIKNRYGSPEVAYNTWLSRSPHWYALGGIVGDPRLANTASRPPPPKIPISQGPTAPGPGQKKTRAMNPLTGKYETHTRNEWEKIREKKAAQKTPRKKAEKIPAKSRPPIGHKHKPNPKKREKKKQVKSIPLKGILRDLLSLEQEPPLVDPTTATDLAEHFGDSIDQAKDQWGLSDEQQFIAGLFNIKTSELVPPQAKYDPDQFELRQMINWGGGTDAESLMFVPGINQHVEELTTELGMEGRLDEILHQAVGMFQARDGQMHTRVDKRMHILKEMASLVSLWRRRRKAAQKQYDRERRHKGTWQDRVAANDDEIFDLQEWLRHNSSANTDTAKAFKVQARDRIALLHKRNASLRKKKPPPSKEAKEALHRINMYGSEIGEITGSRDAEEPPEDLITWNAGGKVRPLVDSINTLNENIVSNAADMKEVTDTQIPLHLFNQDVIRKEINDWSGTVMPAEAVSPDNPAEAPVENAQLVADLRQQLNEALQSVTLQNLQMDIFRGIAPYVGRFQHGGWVPQTGLAMLEKGEYVIPDRDGPNPPGWSTPAPAPINVTLVLDGQAASLVKLVDQRIDSKAPMVVSQVSGRKSRMIRNAPGR